MISREEMVKYRAMVSQFFTEEWKPIGLEILDMAEAHLLDRERIRELEKALDEAIQMRLGLCRNGDPDGDGTDECNWDKPLTRWRAALRDEVAG